MMGLSKETVDALMAQREMLQGSLDGAIREVSERVWDEAVGACQEQAKTSCTSEGFTPPENPHTIEAVERAKREAGK